MAEGATSSRRTTHAHEVRAGERFEFGKNWRAFLSVLNDERIAEAERSLVQMLECDDLRGKSFLDIGSGSGLFSLAARRLGARVHSFDYDPNSVGCGRELRQRFFAADDDWTVEEGSVLDEAFVHGLGSYDIVYSWGVLHHTGEMWKALEHAAIPVAPGGLLFIGIYHDRGFRSRFWTAVKRTYCSGAAGRLAMLAIFVPYLAGMGVLADLLNGRNPLRRIAEYKRQRGMSIVHDWVDWLGGYPFEVARPEQIFDFYRARGFELRKLVTTNTNGVNQFVFERRAPPPG